MKGHFNLKLENVMSVESDGYRAKITVFDYNLEKHKYLSKSITMSLEHIGALIKMMEVLEK
jgi:hypothetical protein